MIVSFLFFSFFLTGFPRGWGQHRAKRRKMMSIISCDAWTSLLCLPTNLLKFGIRRVVEFPTLSWRSKVFSYALIAFKSVFFLLFHYHNLAITITECLLLERERIYIVSKESIPSDRHMSLFPPLSMEYVCGCSYVWFRNVVSLLLHSQNSTKFTYAYTARQQI